MFAAWGRLIHRRKWLVLGASTLLLIVVAGTGFGLKGQLNNVSHVHFESQRASTLLNSQLSRTTAGVSTFEIVFRSPDRQVGEPEYRSAVEQILQPLRADRRISEIQTAYSVPAQRATALKSRDGREMLAVVTVSDDFGKARGYFHEIADKIRPAGGLTTYLTGTLAISTDFDRYLGADLQRAEVFSLVLSPFLLLIIFGTLVSAFLPIGVGAAAVVAGIAGTLLLARVTDVSTYALNIVTLIGLGVAIDYCLLMVNRYREELGLGTAPDKALERTMETAGRAVAFSGLTVAIGLAGMLFYPGTFLVSMGVAGSIVVALAVIFALSLLPALLVLLGGKVNRLRVPWFGTGGGGGFWHGMARWVMRRPLLVLLPTLGLILLAASPFASLRLANGDEHMLPPQANSRQGLGRLESDFPGQDQNTFAAVVQYPGGLALTPARVDQLYDFGHRLAGMKNVIRVDSAFTFDPALSREQYQAVLSAYQAGATSTALPPEAQQVLKQSIGRDIVAFYLRTNRSVQSADAVALLRSIRAGAAPAGSQLLVTGGTAFNQDFINLIVSDTPAAVLFVVLVTYIVLFLLVGSVILPLKAVLTNLLSISASFGLLVWVFQQGHLSGLLNFTPQDIDPTVPVIMFCIVFGLSMDYEVMLLSRIQEAFRRTGDNVQAVAEGLERSGRLITGAAAIMITVFLAFGLAEVLLIKSIGIGLAAAVFIDATLMRMLIVPSVMRLLGDFNWWAPHPLRRLHEFLRLGESAPPPPVVTVP